jgi:hypothetical protein
MTQDEIIQMAQECGLIGMRPHLDGIYSESLIAFANLVAAKAIAELESQEPVAHLWECLGRWSAYLVDNGTQADCAPPQWLVDAIKNATHPPQRTEQEPVAWIHNFIEGGISIGKRPADLERHPDRWTALYKDQKPCPTCEALARTVMLDQTSHDTTPLERTWVGLTNNELQPIADEYRILFGGWVEDFARAIEAKLKQKNGYAEEKNT